MKNRQQVGIIGSVAAVLALAGGGLFVSRQGPACAVIPVAAGADLQATINAAKRCDTLTLEAGAVYVGPFTLPNKGDGDAWITIQSSRLGELPESVRVSPQHAPLMPKIVTATNGASAIYTAPGASRYRLLGIELATASEGVTDVYGLMRVGEGNPAQDTLAEMPSHFEIDRCYIHGTGAQNIRRGLALHSAHTDVTNSYLSNFKWKGMEAQAIIVYNGTGPYRIINNYLEGAGENIMFGGSAGGLDVVPTGIDIRRNHFFKPPAWRGQYTVKNLLEFKTGKNITVEGNVFENNWTDAQVGYAILFTPRPNDSGPSAVVEEVLFTNNILRNTGGAVNILGADNLAIPEQRNVRAKRIRVVNNLFENVTREFGDGAFLKIGDGAEDVTVDHNTVFHTGNITAAYGAPMVRFGFTNNLLAHNAFGIHGDSAGVGNGTISQYFPGSTITGNVLVGVQEVFGNPVGWYPAGQFFPRTWVEVGFVNLAGGDYRLRPDSTYRRQAADGRDVGCDLDAILAAQTLPAATPTPQASPVTSPQPSASPSPTHTPTATPSPQPSPSASPVATPTPQPTPTATPKPSPTPAPTPATVVNALVIRDASGKVISNTVVPLDRKATMLLMPVATDAQGNVVSGAVITCSSESNSIATVTTGYKVTAKKKTGEARIGCYVTVPNGSRRDSFKVRVH